MKKKKKLTNRQKAINRIIRRLNTMESKGITLKIKPTKKNIKEVLSSNHARVTEKNLSSIVDEFVSEAPMISRSAAKKIKGDLGLKKILDVQKISGEELHKIIKDFYDNDNDELAEGVLLAYGY